MILFLEGSDGSLWPVSPQPRPPAFPFDELYVRLSDVQAWLAANNIEIKWNAS